MISISWYDRGMKERWHRQLFLSHMRWERCEAVFTMWAQCLMSHMWMSHVTHMNESCHTKQHYSTMRREAEMRGIVQQRNCSFLTWDDRDVRQCATAQQRWQRCESLCNSEQLRCCTMPRISVMATWDDRDVRQMWGIAQQSTVQPPCKPQSSTIAHV